MKISLKSALTSGAAAAALVTLTACGGSTSAAEGGDEATAETITVETNNGPVDIPADVERVAVLNNTTFATLKSFGIDPVAVPKPLLPNEGYEDWESDEAIFDAGSHREADLEAVSEAAPDLIIGGGRFAEYTGELEKIAPVVDVQPDEESEDGWVGGLRHQTEVLGEIFDEEEAAGELVAALDEAQAAAGEATGGETVFLANASGGKIDNGAGRIGRLLEGLDLEDSFASEDLDGESVHNDSGLAPETVAEADPDWMIVMDRDAAVSTADDEFTPAESLIGALDNVWADTTFFSEDQIIYLEKYFYVTEGIEAYTAAYGQIAEAFTK
ncbi:ABC transporter substrate-binding protein [Zhihengliuella salsuginis]|uniref:Iron ABC transporter substrate-binding protein n=1 Tax=Zhihengliuella salsuginis TaxID=578222 RepID=A0ABQ3GFV4_9MICC|nr:ABC transporter substrate-binding protein [Zhihengliuella salsuginis]GHD02316.1 iron ABC transporter substrate-binding protein [Zhihengliuella salsuginis]